MEPTYRDWGDLRDQHLVGDWDSPLPQRVVKQIRPLAFAYTRWLWDNVFGTDQHPFDPGKATGWMARVFQARTRQERAARTLKTLVEEFHWTPDDAVFVIHAPEHGYQTNVGSILDYHERFFTYFDTGIVCHPSDQNVVVFWDGAGPYCGRRRDRHLSMAKSGK